MIRVLRVKATGQWCGPAIIDKIFPEDDGTYADSVAATLGLPTGSLETIDAKEDPRDTSSDKWLHDPNVPAPIENTPVSVSFTEEEIIKLKELASKEVAAK